MNKLIAAPVILVLLATPSLGATVFMDISDQSGFTRLGATGIQGNGYIYTSPKYFFEPGTTIDFGTATVIGDGADGRVIGCAFPQTHELCLAGKGVFKPYFLTDGQGGPAEGYHEIALGGDLCVVDTSVSSLCAPSVFRLLLTLGPDNDGVQLVFQGRSLDIVPIPLPPALLLFLGGLSLLAGWKINVGSRSIFVDSPQKI